MSQTLRLVDSKPKPSFFETFRKKKEPAPDFIEHELLKMRTVDACVDCIRRHFPSENDQFDISEMIDKVLRNASRNLRQFEEGQE